MLARFPSHTFKFLLIFCTILSFTSCKVSQHYSHNETVKQEIISDEGDSVVIKAGTIYEASGFQKMMLGKHYRDIWTTAVKVPKIDFDSAKGGLTILEKGGGQQTLSLKVKTADGKLYNLRSLQKDPTAAIPEPLRASFADDVVQDQISATNPYAPFILPPLGESVGIYHTNPQIYYIADSPQLGEFRDEFAGVLVMLEEDADEDWSDYEDFGYTPNAVSTNTVMERMEEDNDNEMDQENLLKVRLFDMWIGDWDRHQGQYRWAELPREDGFLYRPIPEDRDNMFFRSDGVIPWIASRKWAMRQFQDFYDTEVRDIAGLNWQARHLDRRFLTDLNREEWMKIADELKITLSDEDIERAVNRMPDTITSMYGDTIVSTLKQRRENLQEYASRYYQILAKEVDVVGSDESEFFEVSRLENNHTKVIMYKSNEDGEKKKVLYERIFCPKETDEVRFYGLEGEDYFEVKGESKNNILLRMIGGGGEDHLIDSSKVGNWGNSAIYYDLSTEENEMEAGEETKLVLKNSLDVNRYNFTAYKYDYLGPSLFMGYNSDYGVFIGGGLLIRKHAFRKDPYASEQRIVANISPSTSAWNFLYEGDFVDVFGDVGFNLKADLEAPNYFTNFYGFGNESSRELGDDKFYRVNFDRFRVDPTLKLRLSEKASVKFGPSYRMVNVSGTENRYFESIDDSLSPNIYEKANYLGFVFGADVMTIEDTHFPERGIRWQASSEWYENIDESTARFGRISTDFSAYYTFNLPVKTTLAARIGGATNTGDYKFYDANSIGGNRGFSRPGTVRGYHRDRFTGRSSLYQNTEIRMNLFYVPFYYLPFSFGISAHHDVGRVWADGEESDKWHSGKGGGIWFGPLEKWVFTVTYTQSEEEELINANFGFLF